jgi:hypothetical protein
MNRWKPVLNAFAIAFEGRIFPNNTDNDNDNQCRRCHLHRTSDSPDAPTVQGVFA